MTPTEKLVRCKEIWRNTMKYRAEGEGCVMKLMRHPDTTPEQLQECRQMMLNIEDLMRGAVTSLRRVYPKHTNQFFLQNAWWEDEYNRYEVKHGD
jgi:hypothetical protein